MGFDHVWHDWCKGPTACDLWLHLQLRHWRKSGITTDDLLHCCNKMALNDFCMSWSKNCGVHEDYFPRTDMDTSVNNWSDKWCCLKHIGFTWSQWKVMRYKVIALFFSFSVSFHLPPVVPFDQKGKWYVEHFLLWNMICVFLPFPLFTRLLQYFPILVFSPALQALLTARFFLLLHCSACLQSQETTGASV